jgi:hypothetical protein
MMTNPGFMIGESRSNFMLQGMSPDVISRVYGSLYKSAETRYDLFSIAYEYRSLTDLQADLPRINAGLKEEGMDDRATITVFQNYIIVVKDDDGNASMEFIQQLTDKLRSKIPGYKSSDVETPLTSSGENIEKLSGSYTIKDLILQPDEVPSRYVLQESLLEDENITNPGFVPKDIQSELLTEIGASPTLVKQVYGVRYQKSTSRDGLFIFVLEYGNSSDAQSALSGIDSWITEQEGEDTMTVTAFKHYVMYLYADESPELVTLLTKNLRAKLPN